MITSIVIFIAVLIFASGVLVTGKLSRTVLFLSLFGFAMSLLLYSLGAKQAAIAQFILGTLLIPYLFHSVMLHLPKEVQEEKTDWVFPFQDTKGKTPLPVAIKAFPFSLIFFALLSWLFVPMFFRNISNFLIKLSQPEPFLNILWETKKLDFFAVFAGIAAALMFFAAERESVKFNDKKQNQCNVQEKPSKNTNIAEDIMQNKEKTEENPVLNKEKIPEKSTEEITSGKTDDFTPAKEEGIVKKDDSENKPISSGNKQNFKKKNASRKQFNDNQKNNQANNKRKPENKKNEGMTEKQNTGFNTGFKKKRHRHHGKKKEQ